MSRFYGEWPAYVPVAERRKKAEKEVAKLLKKGRSISPVAIAGRAIATTVWGKAWCVAMESFHDYRNRLDRGRAYVRNGLVVDLQITPQKVTALVSGSTLYTVVISIKSPPKTQWEALCRDCAGGIETLVELLQGRLSTGVMERICRLDGGLFPKSSEINFACSCPDSASMCKHVAATLYGIGSRLDHQPELLFTLRDVDHRDLVSNLGQNMSMSRPMRGSANILETDNMAALFGIDIPATEEPSVGPSSPTKLVKRKARVTKAPKPPLELTADGYVKWWKR
jgi:uncharacterized Zn finger protein